MEIAAAADVRLIWNAMGFTAASAPAVSVAVSVTCGTGGGATSLSAIVPLAEVVAPRAYPAAAMTVSVTDSEDSTAASSTGRTVTMAVDVPAAMVSTPPLYDPPVTVTV
jgi:hypothetical protein